MQEELREVISQYILRMTLNKYTCKYLPIVSSKLIYTALFLENVKASAILYSHRRFTNVRKLDHQWTLLPGVVRPKSFEFLLWVPQRCAICKFEIKVPQ